jgi:hypothetical protein
LGLAASGHAWQYILNYYYDYGEYVSDMGDGPIRIINLNHTPVETGTYTYDATSHWRKCSICGCIHSKQPHNFVEYYSRYRCTVCGLTVSSIVEPDVAPSVYLFRKPINQGGAR